MPPTFVGGMQIPSKVFLFLITSRGCIISSPIILLAILLLIFIKKANFE